MDTRVATTVDATRTVCCVLHVACCVLCALSRQTGFVTVVVPVVMTCKVSQFKVTVCLIHRHCHGMIYLSHREPQTTEIPNTAKTLELRLRMAVMNFGHNFREMMSSRGWHFRVYVLPYCRDIVSGMRFLHAGEAARPGILNTLSFLQGRHEFESMYQHPDVSLSFACCNVIHVLWPSFRWWPISSRAHQPRSWRHFVVCIKQGVCGWIKTTATYW